MTTQIGLFEAKTNFGQFAKRASLGEIIEITDRGKPLARLVPAKGDGIAANQLLDAFERFKAVRESAILNPAGLPKISTKDLIKDGRKW